MPDPLSAPPRRGHPLAVTLLLAGVLVVGLLPWWRNHQYLRDFYDYGLVMSGVGRIEAGERPYVDFVTPIQTGLFLFNGWAEKLGGGTFQGMTRGAPVLVILGVAAMALVLARRWPAWLAVVAAGALTCLTAAQHTIIWHNTLGAICLAVAACGAAVAPVLRRADWPWHVAVGLALALGGITKLNAHLVALAGVTAWALLAGFSGRAEWRRVAATLGLVVVCGVVLPLGFELAWTGATPAAWWYNVVALPFSSRSGDMAAMLHWKFYVAPRHDYYGPMPVPQLGLVGLAVTAAFVVHGIRSLGWRQAGWLAAAALFAAVSGAGLIATNYEIAYVAMGAWFALVASLWLGFGLRGAGGWFYGGLMAPLLALGAVAWLSAWQGQRSQFGHSPAPRAEYRTGETIAVDFGYMRGTWLPPTITTAMSRMAEWRSQQPATERDAIFYGPALEWLERVWPAQKVRGLPLWRHGGTTYGPREEELLLTTLLPAGPYHHVLVPEAWDYWGEQLTSTLGMSYVQERMGGAWLRYDRLGANVVSQQPLRFLDACGGTTDSRALRSTGRILGESGRGFLGTTAGRTTITLTLPTNRLQGQVVLRRQDATYTGTLAADFALFAQADETNRYPRWSQHLELPAGQEEVTADYAVDSSGMPAFFVVEIPAEFAGKGAAGWRGPRVTDNGMDGPAEPAWFQTEHAAVTSLSPAAIAGLLPAGATWQPPEIKLRRGRVVDGAIQLDPGGELWVRVRGMVSEFSGRASVDPSLPVEPRPPVLRCLWLKGARLEICQQSVFSTAGREIGFRAWTPEPGGWMIFMADPTSSAPAISLRITAVTGTP